MAPVPTLSTRHHSKMVGTPVSGEMAPPVPEGDGDISSRYDA